MISVVIPLYNKEKVIVKTLDSLKRQLLETFELIIVNDGSTDNSLEVVGAYFQTNMLFAKRINLKLIQQKNAGVSAARNRGIEEASGRYIAFLDADDEWDSKYLVSMIDLIDRYPTCRVFASSYCFKRKNGISPIYLKSIFQGKTGILENYFVIAANSQPPLWTSAVIVEKEAICSIGGFPVGVRLGEDLVTWAKLACRYKIAYTKSSLAIYNQLIENYETGCYAFDILPISDKDIVGKMLAQLQKDYPNIKGLKKYLFLWHKIRFVMFVHHGRRMEAFIEWRKTLPYGLLNGDCYYRLFLNFLPLKCQKIFIKVIGKA